MTKAELSQKLGDFIDRYKGREKGYPTDSSYSGECLSIVKLYIQEVFGIIPPPSGSNSAYGYWTNFPSPLPTLFDKVQNTLTAVPEAGSIPIWNTSVGGGFGHIDIFVSGDVNAFTGFDQNWNGRQAHLQVHAYTNVVGWLRPKLQDNPLPDPCIVTDQTKIPQIGNREVQSIASELKDLSKGIAEAQGRIVELEAQIKQLQANPPTLDPRIPQIKEILYSWGFWWTKLNKIKALLPQ